MTLTEAERQRAAYHGGYLINEAIRELVVPTRVMELTKPWEAINPVPMAAIVAVRNMVLRSLVVNLHRLHEARENLLCPWVFSDEELSRLGLPKISAFLGGSEAWKAFVILRHQYAGHALAREATVTTPGELLPALVLGKAIQATGLSDLPKFLTRTSTELAPGVETVRDEIGRRYPGLRDFIQQYAVDMETARITAGKERS